MLSNLDTGLTHNRIVCINLLAIWKATCNL